MRQTRVAVFTLYEAPTEVHDTAWPWVGEHLVWTWVNGFGCLPRECRWTSLPANTSAGQVAMKSELEAVVNPDVRRRLSKNCCSRTVELRPESLPFVMT